MKCSWPLVFVGFSLWLIVAAPSSRGVVSALAVLPPTPRTAMVVGGGPAGLSTAIILARNHGYSVKVLETATKDNVASYDRNKAYLYNINMRGQVMTKRMPSVQ